MYNLLDYRNIDEQNHPGTGPVHQFFFFNSIKLSGVCLSIAGPTSYEARRRVYENCDSNQNLLEGIITHSDLVGDKFKNDAVSRLLFIVGVAYCFVLELTPEQIIFPAGMYGRRCEMRAMQGFLRPKTTAEIAEGPEISRRLSQFILREREALHGLYCVDRAKLDLFYEEIELILTKRMIRNRFGRAQEIPNDISPKIWALLELALMPPNYALPPDEPPPPSPPPPSRPSNANDQGNAPGRDNLRTGADRANIL